MENKFKKAPVQKRKKIIVSVLHACLFAYLAAFGFGCNEPFQTTPGDISGINVTPTQAEALRIVREALSDPNPDIRFKAIEVVAGARQIKLMPQVHRLLQDEFPPVRFAAALAVGDLRYSLAEKTVGESLKDEDLNVVIAACYAMGKLGSTEYFQVLRKTIDNEDQTVRANAAMLLGKSGDKGAIRLLYAAMQRKDSHDKVVFQAAESIAMLGDEQIYPKLWAMLISAYADVRLAGIGAMRALETREARNALITMLDDDVLEIRLAAAEHLGMLNNPVGEREVLDVFEKNLTAGLGLDREARDRVNARTALAIGQICTPALTKYLPQLLKDESKFVRLAAAKAVFQCKMK